jgi:2-polyprenyl-3-methyl-5-hydroxy-6-metoxy-1,4-benzoquinol methylase
MGPTPGFKSAARKGAATVTKEEAELVLRDVQYWHYPFDLPGGRMTPSRPGVNPQRHFLRKKHFFDPLVSRYSGSLRGKTILDLGCCQGFWSIQASRAGAASCLGIDSSEAFVNEARAVATVLEIDNCRFLCRLLETDPWWQECGKPDISFMLGIFYHLTDPIFVLRKTAELTSETLVIDTETLSDEGSFLRLVPRDLHEPTTSRSRLTSGLRLVPTKNALLELISDAGFTQIECLDPDQNMPPEYLASRRISVIAHR